MTSHDLCDDSDPCTVDSCAPTYEGADDLGCVFLACGCAAMVDITGNGLFSHDNTGGSDNLRPECSSGGLGPEAMFELTVTEPTYFIADSSPSARHKQW